MIDPRDKGEGWIGVDLDGTLAHHDPDAPFKGESHVGAPIKPMVDRVNQWLDEGKDVRIFTARAPHPAIRAWCKKYLGQILPITNIKDKLMIALYDDRAFQVEHNTGKIVGEKDGND